MEGKFIKESEIPFVAEVKDSQIIKLENFINELTRKGFSGRIEIDFQYGSVGTVRKIETFKFSKK